ncbi:Cytochrome P450 [Lentzea albidocapillata subsp. violacea]|uniref:Cytochrome P450 n=1 Tax=Lentzea albidocapillata subsp. violacea TaxID=128104 RepID=A0A1G9P1U2_9PSEU|nr:cytochrome P450 [Lentzea albidocapillata]SDL92135.1 Cytochrome P450 [Lentzea albidocapillata subsp. violacea]
MAPTYPFSETDGLTLDPTYERLRREEPVSRVTYPYGGEGWLVTSYEETKFVLGDPRFSRARTVGQDVPRMQPLIAPGGSILTHDGADHSRMRRLVSKAFTVRRIEELRPRAQQITDELLDRLDNPGDLVEGFSMPFPITIICELLGVPFEDREDFRRWSNQALSTVGGHTPEEATDGVMKLYAYFTELVAKRRAHPTDDLISALVAARDNEDRLSEDELVRFGITLLVAGHETTANMLANSVVTLFEHPDAMKSLREAPDKLPNAIEELLRFIPLGSGAGFPRIATEDVQVGNALVKEGDTVLVVASSANRDEAMYANGGELDLEREVGQHMQFGHGIHFCLGSQLARMELQVALGTLLRRLPGLRLAEPVEFRRGSLVRGPLRLVVAW